MVGRASGVYRVELPDTAHNQVQLAGLAPPAGSQFQTVDVLLIDTFVGGVGYARAADLSLIENCLRLIDQLLRRRCCDNSGCIRCVETIYCHQSDPEAVDLDREAAREIVGRLLG